VQSAATGNGYMLSKTDAIFVVRQLHEKYMGNEIRKFISVL